MVHFVDVDVARDSSHLVDGDAPQIRSF